MAEFSKTVQELVNWALQSIRSATGTTAALYPVGLDYFNMAMQELMLTHDWRWARKEQSQVTVASTRTITLTEGTLKVLSIQVTVSGVEHHLAMLDEDEARTLYPNPADEGSPDAYMAGVYDVSTTSKPPLKTIDILPTPDAVYTLRITDMRSIAAYTSGGTDSQVPPIPQFMYPSVVSLMQKYLMQFTKANARDIAAQQQNYLINLGMAKKFDDDNNRRTSAIRLPEHIMNYRQNRRHV
jgi:hypothetical protein